MGNAFTFFGIAKPKKMFVYTQTHFFFLKAAFVMMNGERRKKNLCPLNSSCNAVATEHIFFSAPPKLSPVGPEKS